MLFNHYTNSVHKMKLYCQNINEYWLKYCKDIVSPDAFGNLVNLKSMWIWCFRYFRKPEKLFKNVTLHILNFISVT